MRVRHHGNKEYLYTGNEEVVKPSLSKTEEVVFVIDPSKSDTAVLVGSPFRDAVFGIYEFSGNDRKHFSQPMDTTLYATQLKKYLTDLASELNVVGVFIEEHIIPKYKQGKGNFYSTTTLIAIRSAILEFIQTSGIQVHEDINNKTWKKSILPDGYRGNKEKGSRRYLINQDPLKWGSSSDNVTDAYCMYLHVRKNYFKNNYPKCYESEIAKHGYDYLITTEDSPYTQLEYNGELDFQSNVAFMVNYEKQTRALLTNRNFTPDLFWKGKKGKVENNKNLYLYVWRV